jgi:hypothetical protein
MPNVHLDPETHDFAERAVPMQQPGLEAFAKLRRELGEAIDELERGGGTPFDTRAYEPDAVK